MIFDTYFTVFIRREREKSVDFILKSAKAFFYYEYDLTVNL